MPLLVSAERRRPRCTGSRKDAERELRRLLRSIDTNEHVDPSRVTVRQWLTTWLDAVKLEVALRTHERYSEIVNNFLAPALGNLPIVKLAPAHIQDAYSNWAIAGRRDGRPGGLSAADRRHLHRVLSAALVARSSNKLSPEIRVTPLRKSGCPK